MIGRIKNIPKDIKQAVYSLGVSVMLISGALLMLNGYLDSLESDKSNVEAMAPAEESTKESTP